MILIYRELADYNDVTTITSHIHDDVTTQTSTRDIVVVTSPCPLTSLYILNTKGCDLPLPSSLVLDI